MRTLTFAEIHARVADHQRAEAAPKPTAIRAVYTQASALADLGADDRCAVLALFAEELADQPA
jgi:hypothetical protein